MDRLLVGQCLYGFCDGYFGRDSYETKRIEAVGVDWIVARYVEDGTLIFASGTNIHEELMEFTKEPTNENMPTL